MFSFRVGFFGAFPSFHPLSLLSKRYRSFSWYILIYAGRVVGTQYREGFIVVVVSRQID